MQVKLVISSYRNAGAVIAIGVRGSVVAVTIRDAKVGTIVPVVARANTARKHMKSQI